MSRVHLLLVILVASQWLSAQVPDYFSNDPHWRVNCESFDGTSVHQSNSEYYIHGDTLMPDGLEYKKLYIKRVQAAHYSGEPYPSTFYESYALPIRQSGKQIFKYGEALPLHDFDYELGDTLRPLSNYYPDEDTYLTVSSVDSILTASGWFKRYDLLPEVVGETYLIEGIGHHFGLLSPPIFQVNGRCDLVCYKQDEEIIFDSGHENCDVVSSLHETPKQRLQVYPNPSRGLVKISLPEAYRNRDSFLFRIISVDGRLIKEVRANNDLEVDITDLPSGIYILNLDEEPASFAVSILKISNGE